MTVHSGRRGFTLIELLVVIAIIGILASIVLASLSGARQKGRDAKRVSDIKELQLALELFYDACGAYPATLTAGATTGCASNGLVSNGYISVIPTDPSNGNSYAYAGLNSGGTVGGPCNKYHIGSSLESSTNVALNSDVNESGGAACAGSGADFNGANSGKCASTDAGVACYDVTP